MYAIIVTPTLGDQVREAVIDQLSFEAIDHFDSEGIQSALLALSRVAVNTLIIDSEVGPEEDLIKALMGYRIARPKTRIILLVPDRKPGDMLVSQLATKVGIYDIIPGSFESDWCVLVEEVLDKTPATYAEAARWIINDEHIKNQSNTERSKSKVTEVPVNNEKIVIERRPLGVITIAVASSSPGAGATHNALAICSFLANRSSSVALLEINKHGGLTSYANYLNAKGGKLPDSRRIGNFDVLPIEEFGTEIDKVFSKIRGSYEYLVIDLGCPEKDWSKQEFNRADLPIIVLPASPWWWPELRKKIFREDATIIINMGAGGYVRTLKNTGLKALQMPYIPDPLNISEAESVLESLLENIIPIRKSNAPLWKKLFKM